MRRNSQQAGTRSRGCRLFSTILIAASSLLAPPAAAEPKAELGLTLVGTVVRESGVAIAIIQDRESGEQTLYHVDDYVNGGRLTSIRDDGVTVAFADHDVELRLIGNPTVTRSGSSDDYNLVQPRLRKGVSGFWRIDETTLTELGNAEELKYHTNALEQPGLLVERVSPDGLFDTLGLEEGDLILNINGRVPSGSRSFAEEIANSDMDPAMLRLEVEREGRMDAVYYEVSP